MTGQAGGTSLNLVEFVAAAAVTTLLFGFAALATAAPAVAVDHVFDPTLSLTGGTAVSQVDPVPDPGSNHPPEPFSIVCGTTVDSHGNVYVASFYREEDESGHLIGGRIDIFNPAGEFLTQIPNDNIPCGPAVDALGNLYVIQRQPGAQAVVRYSPSEYPPSTTVDYAPPTTILPGVEPPAIAVDQANGHLFAAPNNSYVNEYSSASEGNTLLRDIGKDVLNYSKGIAIDSGTGDIFVAAVCQGCPPIPDAEHPLVSVVYVFGSDGSQKATVDGSNIPDAGGFTAAFGNLSMGVDEESGELFVGDSFEGGWVYRFVENEGSYDFLADPELEQHSYSGSPFIAVSNGALSSTKGNVYASASPPGPTPDHVYAFTPAGESKAPTITGTTFESPTTDEVLLSATINPNAAITEYRFEYVDEATYFADTESLGKGHGFDHAIVTNTGSLPGRNQPIVVSSVAAGLIPDTAYRLRAVATNRCNPKDLEAICITRGDEVAFATYPEAPAQGSCPNQALRAGVSSSLPDCRAYELVTPADTNGRYPEVGSMSSSTFSTELASGDGTSLLFGTHGGSLPGLGGNGVEDVFEARRTGAGWQTRISGPNGEESQAPAYGGASPDHGYWFWRTGSEQDHGSRAIGGKSTTYVHLPDGSSRLIGEGPLGIDPAAQGVFLSPGAGHTIFTSDKPLATGASPEGVRSIYDRTVDGTTHVVSIRPSGEAPEAGANVVYRGASADGRVVAFTVTEGGTTTLYVRRDNSITVPVAEGDTTFAGLSADGRRLTYLQAGNLFSFVVPNEALTPVGSGGKSVAVNVSADGSHVYFVSARKLGSDIGPIVGKDNFYVWDAETNTVAFIATLAPLDVSGSESVSLGTVYALGGWVDGSRIGYAGDPSRTTPDGRAIVFESHANLTEYEANGRAEVYRYATGEQPELICISCNPTLVPATTDSHLQFFTGDNLEAARTTPATPVRNISVDGHRVFFQSGEPLVPADVDQVDDVYEWQASGTAGCAREEGCLSLISSGRSVAINHLYAASPSGDDVFFTSFDLLVAADQDATASIYDARVNGGFAEAAEPPCPAEACEAQRSPVPSMLRPGSDSGPGSLAPIRKCRKNQRLVRSRGGPRCVQKHRKAHRRHANARRGGAR